MDKQHTTRTPARKPPLWRGEYDRIYRLMAAPKLRAPAATPRTAADASFGRAFREQ